MDFYRRNIPDGESGLGDPYQRSSRQALAHLFFRVEAFRRAETELGRLYDELTEVLDPDLRFVADVLVRVDANRGIAEVASDVRAHVRM
jgi:hypothetical protein